MSNKGVRKERAVRAIYEKAGWTVVRSGGSLTPFDLIAWNDKEIHVIQLKYGSDNYLKYSVKREEEAYKQYQDGPREMKFKFIKLKKYEKFRIEG